MLFIQLNHGALINLHLVSRVYFDIHENTIFYYFSSNKDYSAEKFNTAEQCSNRINEIFDLIKKNQTVNVIIN